MKAYEIIQNLDPEFTTEILTYFRKEEREIYKTTVATLAAQKKLRPIYVQKKPGSAQIEWIAKTLKQRPSNTVAEHLLQVWLLKTQKDMLIMFVGDLGIDHDEEGGIEELPESIDPAKLKDAINHLLENYPPQRATLYLRVFQLQRPGGWPEIDEALESDERLTLNETKKTDEAPETDEPPTLKESEKTEETPETDELLPTLKESEKTEESPETDEPPAYKKSEKTG